MCHAHRLHKTLGLRYVAIFRADRHTAWPINKLYWLTAQPPIWETICGLCTVWACLSVCFELDWPGPVACHPGPGPGPGPGGSRVLSSCFRAPAPPPQKKKCRTCEFWAVRVKIRAGGVSGSAERSEHLRPNLWQTKVSKKKKMGFSLKNAFRSILSAILPPKEKKNSKIRRRHRAKRVFYKIHRFFFFFWKKKVWFSLKTRFARYCLQF